MAEKVDSFTFTVEGVPVAKERPRKAKDGHFYTPQKTKDHEELIQQFWMANGKKFVEGAIGMTVKAYFNIPKSASKVRVAQMQNKEIRPTSKPDTTNVIKLVEDALNGLAYRDDSYIVRIVGEKYYSLEPRLEVEVFSLSTLERRVLPKMKEDD